MRIHVIDLGRPGEIHGFEYPGEARNCELDSVLYISIPRRASVRGLDAQLKDLRPEWLRAGQVVVLRLHPPLSEALPEDEIAVDALHRRFDGLPVLLARLAADRSIELAPLIAAGSDDGAAYDPVQLLEAVRFAELRSWLEQPGVVLPKNDDFHYEGPNGCRYESFMRVGTAIQRMETLDAAAFWLQPFLRGSPVVVLDAWTINSVALNLSRYATQCGQPCEPVADVESLWAYDEDLEKLRLRLAAVRERIPGESQALLVSSVVSKGQLHRRLEDLIKDVGFTQVTSLALYGREDSTGTVLCRPDAVGRYWNRDETCPLPMRSVPIAPSTYLIEVSMEPSKARIREPNAEQAATFFKKYGQVDLDYLSVHRDGGGRHHMIHVDVEPLLRTEQFLRRLGEVLKPLSPDVVLAPEHPAATPLAREVSRRLRADLIIADESRLPNLEDPERRLLREASDILLVDDVLIDGRRLLGYRNFLRLGGYVSAEKRPKLQLLVGVARPRNYRTLDGIELTVEGVENMVDGFHEVEQMLLPDWDKSECPWCWELRQLDDVGPDLQRSDGLDRRWRMLRDKGRGIKESLFIRWFPDKATPLTVSPWQLGPDSIFPARAEIDLFVLVASALQSLRAAGDLREGHQFPLARLLDPELWLTGRYYDPVIAAAILRATRRHDLRAVQIDDELLKGVGSRIHSQVDLTGEFILAMARGHLPVNNEVVADDGLLADRAADPGFAELMRRLLVAEPGYSPRT